MIKDRLISFLKTKDKIQILPIEETYLKHIRFEKKIILDKNAIKLNYAHLSPYKNTQIISLQNDEELYLWFHEREFKDKIILPQGYILYNYLKKRYHDHIVIIETNPAKILVIKDSILVSQSIKRRVDEAYIKSLQKEYGVFKEAYISINQFEHIEENALKELSFQDLLKFANFNFDKGGISEIINVVALPFMIFVSLIIVLEYMQSFYIDYKKNEAKKVYREYKSKNSKIRKKYDLVEADIQKYKEFIKKEPEFTQKFLIASKLSKELKDFNSTIRYIEFSGDKASVTIKTKRQNELIAKLIKSDFLKDLKVESNYKNKKTGITQVTFSADIVIKESKNGQ